jgi:hypothetical protein
MHTLGYPAVVISWYSSFLSERTTALSFDGQTNIQHPIQTRIPQGSLVSPILFLIYLYPLFDTLQQAYLILWMPSDINDTALVTHGRTRKENTHTLEAGMRMAFT